MLDLHEVATQDLATIGRQAGEECESRLRQIAQASDPADIALQELLARMAAEIRQQARTIQGPRDPFVLLAGSRLAPEDVREFILASLSSLTKGFGEGRLHRDNALFFAESLEEEVSRFYRMLAAHARETNTRTYFSDLSEREHERLRFLREVVLQG